MTVAGTIIFHGHFILQKYRDSKSLIISMKFMEHATAAIYLSLPCVSNFLMMVSMIVVLGAT